MVRVITGSAKGKVLKVPSEARPLTDRIKTSLFDTISNFINGADVLDLFAGSGNFGIEALSRGANYCEFVELSKKASEIINQNLISTEFKEKSKVITRNVNSYIAESTGKRKFDLIFCDPPFVKIYKTPMKDLTNLLSKNGLAIIRYPSKFNPDNRVGGLVEIEKKTYGESTISFYKHLI